MGKVFETRDHMTRLPTLQTVRPLSLAELKRPVEILWLPSLTSVPSAKKASRATKPGLPAWPSLAPLLPQIPVTTYKDGLTAAIRHTTAKTTARRPLLPSSSSHCCLFLLMSHFDLGRKTFSAKHEVEKSCFSPLLVLLF